jgi:flagellar hook-associated protein 2
MAGIASFSGLGSGIDFNQLTEAILAERSRPITQLQTRGTQINRVNDAFKQLNTKLATLTESVNALTNKELGKGRLASSSDTNIIIPTATATAAAGTFEVVVTRLATSLSQTSRVYASANDTLLAGGATAATFELRLGSATTGTAINITSANNSLGGLRDAINAANAGVTALIVDANGSGTQNKLVLSSNATGAAGRVQLVETSATGTAADLNLTSLNPPGATNDFSDLDAEFTVNGLALTRSSNTVSNAVTGVTFNLLDSGRSTIKVSANTAEIEGKIKSFIAAYNDVQDFVAAQYAKDSSGRPSGALVGDPTLRSVQSQLRTALGQAFASNGGPFTNLTQLGIGRTDSGQLTLDSAVLNDKLAEKNTTTFSATSADTNRVTATVTGTPSVGTVSINTTRLATAYAEESGDVLSGAGILNGVGPATFQLQKGGVAIGPTFSITSANNSLTGLRDAINAANGGVTATIISSGLLTEKIVLTSQATGAANRVQLVEVTTPSTGTGSNLNLTPTSVGGSDYTQLDSEAIVNGQTVTRSTNTLTDAVTGLSLSLLTTGATTVTVGATQKKTGVDDVRALLSGKTSTDKGLANEIYNAYKSLSDDTIGVVRKAITGNENSIKRLNTSIVDQLARVSALRQSLSRQFAAADAAINQLNNQGTSLTNIFSAQNSSSSKK